MIFPLWLGTGPQRSANEPVHLSPEGLMASLPWSGRDALVAAHSHASRSHAVIIGARINEPRKPKIAGSPTIDYKAMARNQMAATFLTLSILSLCFVFDKAI
jgi:hypothetical protein